MDHDHPFSRASLITDGTTDRDIRRAVAEDRLTRIRRGHYVSSARWSGAFAEHREVALARAAAATATSELVFSHTTAAALHGLPLARHQPTRTHVMIGSHGLDSGSSLMFRHRDHWDGEVTTAGGLLVTTLARTVFDVVRTASAETAIASADAALRMVSLHDHPHRPDLDAVRELREDIRSLVDRSPGRRGVKQAREIAAEADPLAGSPGESISRLYAVRLGHRDIDLQVEFRGPDGRNVFADFRFAGVIGEFDGDQKYTDPAMLNGRSPQQALIDEKRREDWIRATSGMRVVRWGWPEISSQAKFAHFLRSVGVAPR